MARRICIDNRVVVCVAVPIPRLRTARLRDDAIGRDKPAQPGAVPSGGIPVQSQAALFALARVTNGGLGGPVGVARLAPRFIAQFANNTAAAGGSDAG